MSGEAHSRYEDLRRLVLDGDLVAVRPAHGGWARLVQWATRSPYEHCAIALWLDEGLWVAEMDGAKNVLVPLSQYAQTPFDVFPCPVDRSLVRDDVLVTLRGRIRYDWQDIWRLALNKLFGVPLPTVDDANMICSSWAAYIWLRCGWKPAGRLPSIATPAEVVAALGAAPIGANDP